MDKRKGNVTLCWVPGYAGITGNKEVDEEDKLNPKRRKVPTGGLKPMDSEGNGG
jgi:hypothetical protein